MDGRSQRLTGRIRRSAPARIAPPLGFQPTLDGLRAIAIVLVMGLHFGGFLARFSSAFGVDMFFALSGFLITTLILEEWFNDRFSFKVFYVRRGFRLLPPVLVVLASLLILVPLVGQGREWGQLAGNSAEALSYLYNWRLVVSHQAPSPYLDHLWSLAIEEQFYFVWPVLLIWLLRRGRHVLRWVTGMLCFFVLWSLYLIAINDSTERILKGTDTRAAMVLVGCCGAIGRYYGRTQRLEHVLHRSRVLQALPLATIFGIVLVTNRVRDTDIVHWTSGLVIASLTAITVLGVVGGPSTALVRALSWRPVRYVGRISYELYLWHLAIAYGVARGGLGLPLLYQRIFLWTALSFVAAIATHELISKPLQRRRPQWARGRGASSTNAALRREPREPPGRQGRPSNGFGELSLQ